MRKKIASARLEFLRNNVKQEKKRIELDESLPVGRQDTESVCRMVPWVSLASGAPSPTVTLRQRSLGTRQALLGG